MGKVTGFLEVDRVERDYEPVEKRTRSFEEFLIPLPDDAVQGQASRCMDCGIPFCHTGCPVNNQIPDWNDLVYRDDWQEALRNLHSTNNFPEMTGRICPAPCEAACTLNIDDKPVSIKTIECAIADKGWENGWIVPEPALEKTGKSVGVIGSGPAGLAAAQQLARAGHDVHVYEKNARPGGLLIYGIPDFKMDYRVVARRVAQLEGEGVTFHCGVEIGGATPFETLADKHDAMLLACGSETPRDLPISGRELDGIHFAMDFLPQQNRRVAGEEAGAETGTLELAEGRDVVVIGGGDTGSDCIGTSFRQGAKTVTQLEIMPEPPAMEDKALTWPNWPLKMRTSSSQAEGAQRDFSVMTERFVGENGRVTALQCCRVDETFQKIEGSEFELKADLVLLAMGFVHPRREGLVDALALEMTQRGEVKADEVSYATSKDGLYVAGDMRRGQSLVVWAIREGRQAAHAIDKQLMGATKLPR